MVGVSRPLAKAEGHRRSVFFIGYTVGALLSALFLGLVIFSLGSALEVLVPRSARLSAFAVTLALLGTLDLFGRTPQIVRQTPQYLAGRMPPGWLGFVYGGDIGLHFTTQKTTSLLWGGLLGLFFIAPEFSVAALIMASVVNALVLASAARSALPTTWAGWGRVSVLKVARRLQQLSGFGLLAVAVGVSVHG